MNSNPRDEAFKKRFKNFIKHITDALGVNGDEANRLTEELTTKFDVSDQYRLMDNTHLQKLLEADHKLKTITDKMNKTILTDINDNWQKLLSNMGKLQVLLFIKKLETEKPNCSEILNDIITALNTKIETVNNILEVNIKKTDENTNTKQKYLKYKSKYLHLKNNI